jgi:hypothetical protein
LHTEGVATEFISGPPSGQAPAVPGVPFHVFTPELVTAWNEHLSEEEEMIARQARLLDEATAGKLTQEQNNQELREYWLKGLIGRAYVLGSDMFGAIYIGFGKQAVLTVLRDPRHFDLHNKALIAKPQELQRCPRFPDKAVQEALAIGHR